MHQLLRSQFIPLPVDQVWDFFSSPRNLDRMTPDFMEFEIIRGADEPMFAGQLIEYKIEILPSIRQTWLTEISQCVEHRYFIDEQRLGPYKLWHHLHRFDQVAGGVRMIDRIDYLLPFGPLGKLIQKRFVSKKLKAIFDHRSYYLESKFNAEPAREGTV